MSFQLTPLAGNAVLVEGTDVRGNTGSEVLDSTIWENAKRDAQYVSAIAGVDAAIAEVLAPIQAAADKANELNKPISLDPLFYVVQREGVEHVEGSPSVTLKLDRDGVILRAIEEGHENRLLWVNGELVVTAAPVQVQPAEVTEDTHGAEVTD